MAANKPPITPAPPAAADNNPGYQLIFSLDKHGHLWLGKDALVESVLSVGGYVPDLAVVVDGKIQHAAQLVIGYTTKDLVDIDRVCREHGVSYELFARELTGHREQ